MDKNTTVIIKRVKRSHAAMHGGSWKVAYADFVTAMMSFFLLLWLLSSVNENDLRSVANYFAPSTTSKSESAAGGLLGGLTIGEGAMSSQGSLPSVNTALPPPTIGQGGDAVTDPKEGAGEGDNKDVMSKAMSDEQIAQANQQKEQKEFEKAAQALEKAINSVPELSKLKNNLMVDNTPEGLRIQIVDQDEKPMFPSGSPEMFPHTRAMLDMVAKVIKQLPEKISIAGHTDSKPFSKGLNYDNWDLSVDRALSTQHALLASGVNPDRVDRIVGKASSEPINPKDTMDPRNRRITIVLLRDIPYSKPITITLDQVNKVAH